MHLRNVPADKGVATMATALFQCTSPDVARNMEHCLQVAPVSVLDFKSFGNLACIIFDGDCANMYWWCMDIAIQSPRTCAFIGIDEQKSYADDKYSLTILTGDPSSGAFQKCFVELIEKFTAALRDMSFTDEQLEQICNQCMIGEYYSADLVERVAAVVRVCASSGNAFSQKHLLGFQVSGEYRESAKRDMTIRVMAHICYLHSVLRTPTTKVGGLLRFLFGGVAKSRRGGPGIVHWPLMRMSSMPIH